MAMMLCRPAASAGYVSQRTIKLTRAGAGGQAMLFVTRTKGKSSVGASGAEPPSVGGQAS